MNFSLSEYTKIDVSWRFARDPLESLQRSPRPPSWFQRGRFAAGGNVGDGRTRERGRKGRGKGNGNGGETEEVAGE